MGITGRIGIAALLAASFGIAAPAAEPVRLSVQADRPGAKIDRHIFGQFAEHLGTGIYGGVWVGKTSSIPNVRGIRSDVVAALRDIRVPVVRWPGGCFADEYHWKRGIGPAAQRPATTNSNWGGVIEPNTFGTDEYFDFLGQIGAEAFVSVNIGTGTAEEAGDWLDYMTSSQPTGFAKLRAANGHAAPYKVAYLGLGNENWGCGGAMSADHYAEEMKRFSHVSRNLNEAQTGASAMKRIAVGWDSNDLDYTEAVMKAWKARVYSWDIEGVSLHNYVVNGWPPHLLSTGFDEDQYASALAEAFRMDTLIDKQTAIMDRYDPDKKLMLSVDEWGIWTAPTPGSHEGFLQQQNSLRDALLAAVNLDIFMRHADRVRLTAIAQMVNVLQSMLLTDGPRMVKTPTYYVYKLYLPFQDATFVPVSYQAGTYRHGKSEMPRLDAVAARDAQGRLWLAVTNLDPVQPADLTLAVAGARAGSAVGQVLTAPQVDTVNSFTAPNAVVPRPISGTVRNGTVSLSVPPKSVSVVALN